MRDDCQLFLKEPKTQLMNASSGTQAGLSSYFLAVTSFNISPCSGLASTPALESPLKTASHSTLIKMASARVIQGGALRWEWLSLGEEQPGGI